MTVSWLSLELLCGVLAACKSRDTRFAQIQLLFLAVVLKMGSRRSG
jgi:hypothetical protein